MNVDCYEDPALERYNITFTCPPGLVLTGPSATACMGDGEWEPDPRLAECKGEAITHIPDFMTISC